MAHAVQLADLEECREDLDDDEYESEMADTREQLTELQENFDKMTEGNMSLITETGAMRLVRRAQSPPPAAGRALLQRSAPARSLTGAHAARPARAQVLCAGVAQCDTHDAVRHPRAALVHARGSLGSPRRGAGVHTLYRANDGTAGIMRGCTARGARTVCCAP